MKTWASILVAALVLGLAGLAEARGHAGKRAHAGKHNGLSGTIQSVAADGKSVVVAHKGTTATVALADTTKVAIKHAKREKPQAATLAALHAGERVNVRPAAGTASKIVILDFPKKHHKRGAAA